MADRLVSGGRGAPRSVAVDPQLHIVAPLAGTPLHNRFRGSLLLDDVYSDMSYQGWRLDQSDLNLIASFPDIFCNFYGVPAPALDRARLKHSRGFVLRALERFHWVTAALHQSRGGIQKVFEAWEKSTPAQIMGGEERERYYASAQFRSDFEGFVRSTYMCGDESDKALDALLRLGESITARGPDQYSTSAPAERAASTKRPRSIIPLLRQEVRVFDLDIDIGAVIASLRRGDGLPRTLYALRVTIATRGRWQASGHARYGTDAAFRIVPETVRRPHAGTAGEGLGVRAPEPEGFGRRQVAALTFEELCRQRFLTWRPNSKRRLRCMMSPEVV